MSLNKLRNFYSKKPNSKYIIEAKEVLENGGMIKKGKEYSFVLVSLILGT